MRCGATTGCIDLLLQLLAIGLSNGAVIALNAVGVTLIYGAVRTLNFAHGDLFALSTVVATTLISSLGLHQQTPPALLIAGLAFTLLLSIFAATVVNIGVERAAFRPFGSGARLAPLIASVGLSFILYQAALLWRRTTYIVGEHRSVPGLPETPRGGIPELLPQLNLARLAGLNARYTVADLLILLLALLITALVAWFLSRTPTGVAMRACAQDPFLSELCGVNRCSMVTHTFALGGALAGGAAFLFAIYYARPFGQHGLQSGLIAFMAAVLGGIGRPWGAFRSGLLLGVLAAGSDYLLAAQWTPVLLLGLLIVLLLLRPGGLAGERPGESLMEPEGHLVAARWSARWTPLAVVLLGLALYPLLDRALGLNRPVVVTALLIFAVLALGLNLILGFAGLLDLGYAAFFGVGGYTAALMTVPGSRLAALLPGRPEALTVLFAGASAAALLGLLSSLLTIRLRGDELAISTLALGQAITLSFFNLDSWTGGDRGMSAIPRPVLFGTPLRSIWAGYYLVLALLVVALIASTRLSRSRIGRAWFALGQDELAAWSCGISPLASRALVFVVGAGLAGMAGALSATLFSYVDPGQSELRISAMVLAMVVVGGTGSLTGSILGAFVIAGYDLLIIPAAGAWLDSFRRPDGTGLVALLDVRGLSFLSFGLALYLTVLLRERRGRPAE